MTVGGGEAVDVGCGGAMVVGGGEVVDVKRDGSWRWLWWADGYGKF